MIENDNTRRDQIDICNMAHETNKAMSDQSNTLWLVGGEGGQGSTTFFIDTFILGNQGQVFLFLHLIPNHILRSTGMRISRQYKVQKVADLLHNHWDLIPSTLAAPVNISGQL